MIVVQYWYHGTLPYHGTPRLSQTQYSHQYS